VILNESSKRLNPSLVSFVDKERALGEAATTQVSRYTRNRRGKNTRVARVLPCSQQTHKH
jgi:hypothetical protein